MASIIGDFKRAKALAKKSNSALHAVSHIIHAALPSEYMCDVKGAIQKTLQEELEIYDVELKGVPVAYNEKSAVLTEDFGSIIAAQPYIHCNIQCEFIVFCPKLEDILCGIVNKVTATMIGCLIHGCFYATIHCESSGTKTSAVKVGDNIKLRVVKLEEDGNGVLSITGEMFQLQLDRSKRESMSESHVMSGDNNPDSGIENSNSYDKACASTEPSINLLSKNLTPALEADQTTMASNASSDSEGEKRKKKKRKKEKKKKKKKKKASSTKEKPSISELTNPGTSEQTNQVISEQATTGISEQGTSGISERTFPCISEQTTPGMSEQTTPVMLEQTTPGMSEQTTPGMSEQTTPSMSEQTGPGIPGRASPGISRQASPDMFLDSAIQKSSSVDDTISKVVKMFTTEDEISEPEKEKKPAKKRKLSNPPKATALVRPSVASTPVLPAQHIQPNSQKMEHQRLALYHLQQLGLCVPGTQSVGPLPTNLFQSGVANSTGSGLGASMQLDLSSILPAVNGGGGSSNISAPDLPQKGDEDSSSQDSQPPKKKKKRKSTVTKKSCDMPMIKREEIIEIDPSVEVSAGKKKSKSNKVKKAKHKSKKHKAE